MAILKGPKTSKPDAANIGDLFWDWDNDKTYELTASGWVGLSDIASPAVTIAPSPAPVEEPAPAPKKTRAKKVVPAEKTE